MGLRRRDERSPAEPARRQGDAPRSAGSSCSCRPSPPATAKRARISVGARASREDVALWWEAAALEERRRSPARADRLDALESWWIGRARDASGRAARRPRRARPRGGAVLARLARRSGAGRRRGGASAPRPPRGAGARRRARARRRRAHGPAHRARRRRRSPRAADAAAVARVLEDVAPRDPWAPRPRERALRPRPTSRTPPRRPRSARRRVVDPAREATSGGAGSARWPSASRRAEALPRLLRSVDLGARAGEVERALDARRAARLSATGVAFEVCSRWAAPTWPAAISPRRQSLASARR